MSAEKVLSQFYYILADLRVHLENEPDVKDKDLMYIAAQLTQTTSLFEIANRLDSIDQTLRESAD
jgi:hypothetical protein